jgi:hypothetical protein
VLRESSSLISGQPDVLCISRENEMESGQSNRNRRLNAKENVKMGGFWGYFRIVCE